MFAEAQEQTQNPPRGNPRAGSNPASGIDLRDRWLSARSASDHASDHAGEKTPRRGAGKFAQLTSDGHASAAITRRMVELYNQDKSTAEIGRLYGVSDAAVVSRLRAAGYRFVRRAVRP